MFSGLVSPAVKLMRQLKLAQKFNLVGLAFLVPLIYLLYTVTTDRQAAYDFTAAEVEGGALLGRFDSAQLAALEWAHQTVAQSSGAKEGADKRAAAAQQVDGALAALANQLKPMATRSNWARNWLNSLKSGRPSRPRR